MFRYPLVVVASLAVAACATVDARRMEERFDRWAKAHATPIRTVEVDGDVSDLRPLVRIVGAARVLALGEPAHGTHELLAFRNRLFRYLVEEVGFTAIALETGFSESRAIYDFVAGAPGGSGQVEREGLSWGFFGMHQENLELVQWMRDYNADPRHRRKVRFYGIDLGLAASGATPTRGAVDDALTYLARVDSASGRRLRARLEPYLVRLSNLRRAPFSATDHDGMTAALDDLLAVLERGEPAYTAAETAATYEWARRSATIARQADAVFRVTPPEVGGGIPPTAWRAMMARDSAMAENVLWVLNQEGGSGKVLVFAHNAHVKSARTEGGVWSTFAQPPNAMGQYLRTALGDGLIIIGTSAAQNGVGLPSASVDTAGLEAALARIGPPRFLLDLRPARSDSAVAAFLARRRPVRTNLTTELILSPSVAFDVLFFVDTLRPARGRSRAGER